MQTIFDYLDWRGDLTFQKDPFNEVDNLVLSVLSYMEFEGVVPGEGERGGISLPEAAEHFKAPKEDPEPVYNKEFYNNLPKLLLGCAQTERFKDLQLSHYVNEVDFEKTKQFSALVFSQNWRTHFIAFSGTGETLAGWKEDLQMSFKSAVPAQKQAATYTKKAMSDMPGRFMLGGHSKGGNLAVFAAANLPKHMQRRLTAIYNNDGPGFQSKVINSTGYQNIVEKVNTYLPKSSVVGMILEHSGDYKVVGSFETGIMQHDAFSWGVRGPHFAYEDGLDSYSQSINKTLRAWLEKVPMDEREEFINALFDILQASGAKTFGELNEDKLPSATAMINTFLHLESQTKTHLKEVLEILFSEGQKEIKKKISEEFDHLTKKLVKKKA